MAAGCRRAAPRVACRGDRRRGRRRRARRCPDQRAADPPQPLPRRPGDRPRLPVGRHGRGHAAAARRDAARRRRDARCPPPANYELRPLDTPFRDPATVVASSGRLEGNNVQVFRGAGGASATGTPTADGWLFDFPFNSAASAETSLFFAANFVHDFFYDLGFDEAAGNFQADNFGRGGVGGDPRAPECTGAADGTTPTTCTRPRQQPDHQHVPVGRRPAAGARTSTATVRPISTATTTSTSSSTSSTTA